MRIWVKRKTQSSVVATDPGPRAAGVCRAVDISAAYKDRIRIIRLDRYHEIVAILHCERIIAAKTSGLVGQCRGKLCPCGSGVVPFEEFRFWSSACWRRPCRTCRTARAVIQCVNNI